MTSGEKEDFCRLMAALFSPPEGETIGHIQEGRVYSLVEKCIGASKSAAALSKGFKMESDPGILLGDLRREYERLFSGIDGKSISLVESSYKSWTQDPECHLPFAREKGFIMGDPALHMAAIFQHGGVQVPDPYKAFPDHLVLELEFLSALYGRATDREIKQFIGDHMDWIPQLKAELIRFHPHSFYAGAIEILDLFLNQERARLEIK